MKIATVILLSSWAIFSHAAPTLKLGASKVGVMASSANDLNDLLVQTHGKHVSNAQGVSSFYMEKRFLHRWRIAATHTCTPEIASPKSIGKTLICPEESAGPCTLSITYQDSQTFTDTVGVHSSFTVEGNLVAARATATFGGSYQYTESYSKGQSLSYTFQLPKSTSCTPTQAMYQMQCTGATWKVMNDKTKPGCDSLQGVDWQTSTRWFQHEKDKADTWHYVHEIESGEPKLLTMKVPKGAQPTGGCSDIESVELRTMKTEKKDAKAIQSIAFGTGQSISAVTCLYQKSL